MPKGGPEPKPGDWYCPACGDLQFARNEECRVCRTPKNASKGKGKGVKSGGDRGGKGGLHGGGHMAPMMTGGGAPMMTMTGGGGAPMMAGGGGGLERIGDWFCPSCGELQFGRNLECRRCATPRPAVGGVGVSVAVMGAGSRGMDVMQRGAMGKSPPSGGKAASFGSKLVETTFGKGNVNFVETSVGKGGGSQSKPGDWVCGACGDLQFARNTHCRRCGAAPGGGTTHVGSVAGGLEGKSRDWICDSCGDLNFGRNTSCRRCGAIPGEAAPWRSGPRVVPEWPAKGGKVSGGKPGDWTCPNCGDLVFASKDACRKCGTPQTALLGGKGGSSMRPGDWICPNCGDLVFASKDACRKCGARQDGSAGGKGGVATRPGDWTCPNCGDLVFARNDACRKCGMTRNEFDGGDGQVTQQYQSDYDMGKSVEEEAAVAEFPGEGEEHEPSRGSKGKGKGKSKRKPGDWDCPKCGDLQFARNEKCRMCSTKRPEEGARDRSRSR